MIEKYLEEVRNTTGGAPSLSEIVPGKLIRFATRDRRGDENGWCRLFEDQEGGVFGCWRQGISETWQGRKCTTPEQRAAFAEKVKQARAEAAKIETERQAECRAWCKDAWGKAKDATSENPYLKRKGVNAYGLKAFKDSLLVPVKDITGTIHGLQFIAPDGTKKFKTGTSKAGHFFKIGTSKDKTVIVCEGYATGASIHQATGHAVVIGFDAGNLLPVAQGVRSKYPDMKIIIAADDDHATEGNPGLTKATETARAVAGLLAIPAFPDSRGAKDTDYNDMARLTDLEAVKTSVEAAAIVTLPPEPESAPQGETEQEGWPEPLPIETQIERQNYPIDALPDTIRFAVEEVLGFVKAPTPLVVSAALSALSMAVQSHADVARAEKLSGPSSTYLLTIAESGERKSTCDGFFTAAIREYEAAQAEAAKPFVKQFEAELAAWEMKYCGIRDSIRAAAKAGQPTELIEADLLQLQQDKPEPPRIPRIIYGDATPAALKYNLAKGWPSGAVVSSEGGIVFGGHGMKKDSAMENLATLNQLWDGTDQPTERRATESYTVKGARFTMSIMVQEATLRAYFKQDGGLSRGTGFLARFLIAWPESTQGFRPFTEAPENWPQLAVFNRRIAAILKQDAPITEYGALQPAMVTLTPEAKAAWVAFHDAIESMLATGGELFDVRDVASKTADNAARLACQFHIFSGDAGAISLDAFESASMITAWHLNEARRFFGGLALPQELADAARLDGWMLEYCKRNNSNIVPIAKIQQGAPADLRKKATIDAAVEELETLDRVRRVTDGKRKLIYINPALLRGEK